MGDAGCMRLRGVDDKNGSPNMRSLASKYDSLPGPVPAPSSFQCRAVHCVIAGTPISRSHVSTLCPLSNEAIGSTRCRVTQMPGSRAWRDPKRDAKLKHYVRLPHFPPKRDVVLQASITATSSREKMPFTSTCVCLARPPLDHRRATS